MPLGSEIVVGLAKDGQFTVKQERVVLGQGGPSWLIGFGSRLGKCDRRDCGGAVTEMLR